MTQSRFILGFMVSLSFGGVAGCNRAAPDTRAADEQTILAAEIEAALAWNAGDIETYLESYPEGSSWLPPNAPIINGPDAIREVVSLLAATPGFAFTVEPTNVTVSRAGDLAYLVGTYEISLNDAEGNPETEHGKYVEVWKKHPDNTWKHVLAIWNSDQPPR